MFRRHGRKFAWMILCAICLSSSALPYKKIDIDLAKNLTRASAILEISNGLKTAVFETNGGKIRFNLPQDIAAGDKISGTIYTFPNGRNESARRKNTRKLNSYAIDVENQSTKVSSRFVKFSLPDKLENNAFEVTLRNSKGKEVSSLRVPALSPRLSVIPTDFELPFIGQTGEWVNVFGNFDGDLSNTGLYIGNQPAIPLAESPRRTVFQSPANVVGQTKIKLREGNTEITQDFRNVNVILSSPKLKLTKGETTTVNIKVEGLKGIEDEIPLHLNCTGSANMQGGNVQNLQISPNSVKPDGTFTQTRNLIGVRRGNFNINAKVLINAGPLVLAKQVVHVEKDPINIGDEKDKVWWLKIKTLGGKIVDIFIKQNFKPNLKFCDWIVIKKSEKDDINRVFVSEYQKVDDPSKPCTLTNQTVHVEGDPIGPNNGAWQIKVKTLDGKTVYIWVRSPTKPDLEFCNWIKLKKCKKISSNTFAVEGYDVVSDPTKKPPAPPVTPTPPPPTPTPEMTAPPVATVKPCKEGAVRNKKEDKRTFEIMDTESTVSMTLSTDKGGSNDAANMAAWLRGLSTLGGYIEIPEGARGGAAVATAALKYLEVGADILSALGKSGLRNKRVLEVKISIYISTKKVSAVCTTFEVCLNGAWVTRKKYSETQESSSVRKDVTLSESHNDWDKIVSPRTRTFVPAKFEAYAKELLKKEMEKLKKNGEDLDKFKANCK